MMTEFRLETPRLLIRQWREEDKTPLAQLNADARVMRYFESTLTREDSDAGWARMRDGIAERGYGFGAAELKETGELIGIIGLFVSRHPLPFPPEYREIGWRLAHAHWNQGYATEGARACVEYGFNTIDAPALYAITAIANQPSRHVMEKLGMVNDAPDFDHPAIAADSLVLRHCGYSLQREDWVKGVAQS